MRTWFNEVVLLVPQAKLPDVADRTVHSQEGILEATSLQGDSKTSCQMIDHHRMCEET
jgi:hypothetical protein